MTEKSYENGFNIIILTNFIRENLKMLPMIECKLFTTRPFKGYETLHHVAVFMTRSASVSDLR